MSIAQTAAAFSFLIGTGPAIYEIAGEPQITFQGVAGLDPTNGFAGQARNAISEAISEMKREQIADTAVFKENLRIHLKRFVQRKIQSKPVIVTTIVEI